jgi:hypothetical protein
VQVARSNSPGYPNLSLPKAIAAARKVFDADRRNPVDRVTAAKHIGYGGQSGASDKALASLAHYGLTEKTGKGEIRVSQLALDIIHPEQPGHKPQSLLEAGMKPQIFKDIRERFGGHVSEDNLRSYLVREGFQNIAIPQAMNAYFETCRFLEQEKAFESRGNTGTEGGESVPVEQDAGDDMEDVMVQERRASPTPQLPPLDVGETEWMRNRVGRDTKVRLLVTGDMGPKEIGRLIKLLEAQKAVLDDDEDDA